MEERSTRDYFIKEAKCDYKHCRNKHCSLLRFKIILTLLLKIVSRFRSSGSILIFICSFGHHDLVGLFSSLFVLLVIMEEIG